MNASHRLVATLVGLVLTLATPALAQNDEITQLRRDVASLREQLAAQQQQVRSLQAQRDVLAESLRTANELIASLRAGGEVPAPGDPNPAGPTAPIPDDPFAAPEAMYAELVRRYEQEFGDSPAGGDQAALVREVEQWARLNARSLRKRVTWLVTVSEIKAIDRSKSSGLMTVLDEVSGLPIGKPFRVQIPRSHAERINRMSERYDRWRATVVFQATPTVNPDRPDPGVFDTPRLLGPYAEFGYTISLKSILGEKSPANPAPGAPSKNPPRRSGR